jgi:hypothetical protein
MSAKYNMVIDQGSDYDLKLSLSQGGAGLSLVGYVVRGQIRSTIASSTVAATFTPSVIDDTTGIFMISLSAATTAAMTAGQYVYDIELYKAPYVTRILEGTILLKPEVTR